MYVSTGPTDFFTSKCLNKEYIAGKEITQNLKLVSCSNGTKAEEYMAETVATSILSVIVPLESDTNFKFCLLTESKDRIEPIF